MLSPAPLAQLASHANAALEPPLRASICIPTRNRARLLRETLESLDRQSVAVDRLQVIVGDDGSNDGTIDMLRGLQPAYELKWTRLHGQGSGAARNAAARLADHEVLIFLDDDQITTPDLVAAHLDVHQRDPTVVVQGEYPLAAGWDQGGASLIFERSRRRSRGPANPTSDVAFRLWGANFSVRRVMWAQVGGFDERLPRSQDLEFGLRLADLGLSMVVESRALSHHLHAVSAAGFRRQCFDEGRCMVRIWRKRGVSVESLLDGPIDRPVDRLLRSLWDHSPALADRLGRSMAGVLWMADRARLRPAQVFASRLVRRFHELGGIAVETAAPVGAGVPG
jgi:GT2 family glycosyltransferase